MSGWVRIAGGLSDPGRRRHDDQGLARLRMKTIVNALERRFPGNAARDNAAI
jgi:hypothetical protein